MLYSISQTNLHVRGGTADVDVDVDAFAAALRALAANPSTQACQFLAHVMSERSNCSHSLRFFFFPAPGIPGGPGTPFCLAGPSAVGTDGPPGVAAPTSSRSDDRVSVDLSGGRVAFDAPDAELRFAEVEGFISTSLGGTMSFVEEDASTVDPVASSNPDNCGRFEKT